MDMDTSLTFNMQRLDQVAWNIDRRGINSIPAAALRELGFLAKSAGVSQIVTDLLVDANAPAIARERAFGNIASLVSSPVTTGAGATAKDNKAA